MYNNLRPHFIVRRYSFAGAAFPRDSGEGGVNDWNLCVCMQRREMLNLLEFLAKEGPLGQVVRNERLEILESDGEDARFEEGFISGLHLILMLREHSSAIRRDIASDDCRHHINWTLKNDVLDKYICR
jgi:hypothetical protein